jgi:hypothetical protein
MTERTIVFAPCAFNLAETSRMVEIAKAVAREAVASKVFDIQFISDGGEFKWPTIRSEVPPSLPDGHLEPVGAFTQAFQ